jgi:integrase
VRAAAPGAAASSGRLRAARRGSSGAPIFIERPSYGRFVFRLRRAPWLRVLEPAPERTLRALLEVRYGSGLRVSACRRLDVGDPGLAEMTLLIRDGKGQKGRIVPLTARAAMRGKTTR